MFKPLRWYTVCTPFFTCLHFDNLVFFLLFQKANFFFQIYSLIKKGIKISEGKYISHQP